MGMRAGYLYCPQDDMKCEKKFNRVDFLPAVDNLT
jgi:hypothetical protein